jgi:hypothetical protein
MDYVDCGNVNILQILSPYLYEDTLLHLYQMMDEKYYLQLAELKTRGSIESIYNICNADNINGLQYRIKGPSIKICDQHGNKIRIIAVHDKLYITSVYIEDIYQYQSTLDVFRRTFKEIILNEIDVCSNIKKLVELKLGPNQYFNVYTDGFSYYDNGDIIKI